MKNKTKILLLIFSFPLLTFGQNYDDMNKRELKENCYLLNDKIDSLILLIDKHTNNINELSQNLISQRDSINLLLNEIEKYKSNFELDISLIGKTKEEIIKVLNTKNGNFRENFDSLRYNMIVYQLNLTDTIIECYYFNENNIAFSVCFLVFSPDKMMREIKYFNENYIEDEELKWIYYYKNQKLNVSLQGNDNNKYFTVYYTDLQLGDFQKCKKKIWKKPNESDLTAEWYTYYQKYDNELPYFFKSDFDGNGIQDEAWLMYSDDKEYLGLFAYMNNSQSPIEIFTFKFTYNSCIYELEKGEHQVYFKYNPSTNDENDIHTAKAKNNGIVSFNNGMGDFYLWENGKFERYAYSNY